MTAGDKHEEMHDGVTLDYWLLHVDYVAHDHHWYCCIHLSRQKYTKNLGRQDMPAKTVGDREFQQKTRQPQKVILKSEGSAHNLENKDKKTERHKSNHFGSCL
jgi:hypothetical protein